jgi:hypothetical protein
VPSLEIPLIPERHPIYELFLKQFVVILFLLPFVLPIFAVHTGLDPFKYVIQVLAPMQMEQNGLPGTMSLVMIRFTLATVCVYVCARAFAYHLSFISSVISLVLRNIEILTAALVALEKSPGSSSPSPSASLNRKIVQWHFLHLRGISLVHVDSGYHTKAIGILLAAIFITSVTGDYTTISLYHDIPMPLFLYFPMASFMVKLVAQVLLYKSLELTESSEEFILLWEAYNRRVLNTPPQLILLKKEIRLLRPIIFYVRLGNYNLFRIERGTDVAFYRSIFDFTITALMT